MTGDQITGTLRYVDAGTLATDWGAGNFLALDFSGIDTGGLTSLKVGLEPSAGTGLVEVLGDPDMNGVFKIADKDAQRFVVVADDGSFRAVRSFGLSGLVCEGA